MGWVGYISTCMELNCSLLGWFGYIYKYLYGVNIAAYLAVLLQVMCVLWFVMLPLARQFDAATMLAPL